MTLQVQQIIKAALQDIGMIGKSETPTADEVQDALVKLNMMLDLWSVRSLMVLGTIQEGFGLVAGTPAYTIGAGGAFNTSKPSGLTGAFVRDSGNEDTPVAILTRDAYDAIEDKATSRGRPEALYFDPGATQQAAQEGTISLYPCPDAASAYTLFLDEQKALTEFSKPTDTVTFHPAYFEALEYNLAIRLWPQYRGSDAGTSQDIMRLARESMRVIEAMNAKQVTSMIEAGRKARSYNIYTGDRS